MTQVSAQTVETGDLAASQTLHTEIKEEQNLFAEPIFSVSSFPVTNSMLSSFLMLAIILVLGLVIKTRSALVPKGVQNIFEIVIEFFLDTFDSVTGSRQRTMKFFPIVFSFFVFILINNWLGLLPGVGTIGRVVLENGEKVFVPYLRGGAADLNTTLALAFIGVALSHILGVIGIGWWSYLNKFINLKALIEIPKKVKSDPMILFVNPIKFMVGLLEIVSELAKVVSLSFRLFGNIFAGEVLLASMAAILAWGLPIPFLFLEVLVGAVQALIFAMLILTYLSMMTTAEEH